MVQTHTDVPNQQVYFEKINELINFFALTKGFGIVFCVANNFFFRKEVNRQITERLADKDIIIADFLLEEENNIVVVEQLKKLKLEKKEAKGFIINNLDFLLDKQSNALAAFNQSRDVLSKLEMPLLFWLNEENIRSLSKSAPDIYTFRSLPILEFKEIPDFQSEQHLIPRFSEDYRTTENYEKIRLKIELLERQLEEAEAQGYPKGKIIDSIVIPLFSEYLILPIPKKANEIFEKYANQLDDKKLKHLELKFIYYKELRDFEVALQVVKRIADIEKTKNDLDALAVSYYNIARVYKEQEDYAKAIEFQLKSVGILEEDIENHLNIHACYNELATLSKRIGNYNDAENYHLKALEILEKSERNDPFLLGGTHNNLALVYAEKGEIINAEKHQLKALKIFKSNFDDLHPEIARSYHNYATILLRKGDAKKALGFEKKAFDILERGQHEKSPLYDLVKRNLLSKSKSTPRSKKTGRNTLCPCGSNKKYKKCCLNKKEKITPFFSR